MLNLVKKDDIGRFPFDFSSFLSLIKQTSLPKIKLGDFTSFNQKGVLKTHLRPTNQPTDQRPSDDLSRIHRPIFPQKSTN